MLMPFLDMAIHWVKIASAPNQGGHPGRTAFPHPDGELPVLLCPSSPLGSRSTSTTEDWGPQKSYLFSLGDETRDYFDASTTPPTPRRLRGAFTYMITYRLAEFKDGTSNTIAMAERELGGAGRTTDVRGHMVWPINTGVSVSVDPSQCLATASSGFYTISAPTEIYRMGWSWAGGWSNLNWITTILPPNSPSCGETQPEWFGVMSASSMHLGGVHVLMADGAVRFVSDSIDTGDLTQPPVTTGKSPYGVWGALGSRSGGETIGTF